MSPEQSSPAQEQRPWNLTAVKWLGTLGLGAVGLVGGLESYAETSNVMDIAQGAAVGTVAGAAFYALYKVIDRIAPH